LKRFEILVNRGVSDITTKIIELLEDIAGTEMGLFCPEQIQHHAALAAQTHTEISATPIDILNALQGSIASRLRVGDGQTRGGDEDVDHSKQRVLGIQL
jgi:hypothetical protein